MNSIELIDFIQKVKSMQTGHYENEIGSAKTNMGNTSVINIQVDNYVFSRKDELPIANESVVLSLNKEILIYSGIGIKFLCQHVVKRVPEHKHSYFEMVYVFSGRCRQIINGTTVVLHEGDICILDTNTVHSIEPTGENDIIINCLISKNYLEKILLERLSGNILFTNFFINAIYHSNEFNAYILFDSSASSKVKGFMNEILCEYFDKSTFSEEAVNSYLILVFSELLRLYNNKIDSYERISNANLKITDIISYVHDNCREANLANTAGHFHFSPNYLSIFVKKTTGRNFMDILHEAKLKKASFLLKNSNMAVARIANEVGYENTSFFYKLFEKYNGMNPTEFRNNHLESPSKDKI